MTHFSREIARNGCTNFWPVYSLIYGQNMSNFQGKITFIQTEIAVLQGYSHKIGQDFRAYYRPTMYFWGMIVLSADRADSQHSKMGWHISVSQKLWSPAQFLYQHSALGLKSCKWTWSANIAVESSFLKLEKRHGSF